MRYGEERETQPALKVRVCGGMVVEGLSRVGFEPISPQKGGVRWISCCSISLKVCHALLETSDLRENMEENGTMRRNLYVNLLKEFLLRWGFLGPGCRVATCRGMFLDGVFGCEGHIAMMDRCWT